MQLKLALNRRLVVLNVAEPIVNLAHRTNEGFARVAVFPK
jgi:hypothetical protein